MMAPQNLDDDFNNLRNKCFSITRRELSSTVITDEAAPWGVIMEVGYAEAALTIASFADGKVSVLRSAGGQYVGGEITTAIRRAGQLFLKQAVNVQSSMQLTAEFPLPQIGQVCFYFRTDYGTYAAEVSEEDLHARRHEMSALFYAGLCILHEYLQVYGPGRGRST